MNGKITVLGGGSWGTAIAISLSSKGLNVDLWDIDKEHIGNMMRDRENSKFLPGTKFPETLNIKENQEDAIAGSDVILFAVPAQFFRSAIKSAAHLIAKDKIVVNVAKGIEQNTLCLLSEIAEEFIPDHRYVVVSGPSHAEEVCKGMPTTLVAASKDREAAEFVQDMLMSNVMRVYTNDDVVGVELGGALKNIIALGAGICDGLGNGDNAKAALITRGLAEIRRLGVAMGARDTTFAGLSGIGDLIVTCTSMHSRNRRCGIMIGEGVDPEKAVENIGMIVEGVFTCNAAYGLAQKHGVEMPIVENIYKVLNEGMDPKDGFNILMTRQKKHEIEQM
ncbi:MAG: NAD(P)H-dependent glycerol-3-phosphate dehydrogenase [Firmicutes bacterium]|nr:NAD(P)H-dependent glycerol-3-phosphate dehydrogenase [Clostridiales bacterium]MBQ4339738.1 NAD(P)H-dependent glycerol-3-phosphate dehydrogenase [Bacillota bacterium]